MVMQDTVENKPTDGELKTICSSKHPGDIFVKIKGTRDTFLCKFYGGEGKISPTQAMVNVNYFIKSWNSCKGGV